MPCQDPGPTRLCYLGSALRLMASMAGGSSQSFASFGINYIYLCGSHYVCCKCKVDSLLLIRYWYSSPKNWEAAASKLIRNHRIRTFLHPNRIILASGSYHSIQEVSNRIRLFWFLLHPLANVEAPGWFQPVNPRFPPARCVLDWQSNWDPI
jgi:hypothetical protein